jgi:flagellar hook-associated protein 2
MSTSSTMFSGNSRFATDFQTIIERSVALSSGQLNLLQSLKTSLSSQSTALGDLDSKVLSLKTALDAVENALGTGSYSSATSNTANTKVLSAALGTGVTAGSYQIEVTGMGSYTTASSRNSGLPAVSDPAASSLSTAASFTLTVNNVDYTIRPADTTLNSLVAAINGAGADVQATTVNYGTSSSPNYRLALQSTKLGSYAMQLNDGSQDLLSTPVAGATASYKINGGTAVQSDTRTIALSPGLTVTLLAQSTADDATTLTVSRSTSSVSNAFATFVTAYNAALDENSKHRGENPGALAGQSIVYTLATALRNMGSYSDSEGKASIHSLTALGLEFDSKGRLSFDTTVFSSATTGQVSALEQFLGASGTTGSGFLKSANDIIDGLENIDTGSLKTGISSMKTKLTSQDQAIADAQSRLDLLRTNLQTQMAAADALIAGLEQNYSYMSNLISSMSIAAEAYK